MLSACDIYDPPTPLDRLLDYRALTREEQLDAAPGPIKRLMRRITQKVRGFLDLESRLVGVDVNLHPYRQMFLTHHEIGHEVLPWHRKLFVVTPESHLDADTRQLFECEANRFAGHAIFQLNDLAKGLKGRRLRMADLSGVAARYNASLTATVRQYLILQDLPCALLVGEPTNGECERRGIRFLYGIGSDAFVDQYGHKILGNGLPPENPVSACVNEGTGAVEFEIELENQRGERQMVLIDTLFNTYQTLSLLHPIRQKRSVFGRLVHRSSIVT